jgi:small subunit ribosomal protein S1
MQIRIAQPARGNVVLSAGFFWKRTETLRQRPWSIWKGKDREEVRTSPTMGGLRRSGGIDDPCITDMSWGRINHPSDIIKVGQTIKVKVLQFDRENQRLSSDLRTTPDPGNMWAKFPREAVREK